MAGKRSKGEQRQGVCVYCGAEGSVTDDHVFPKVIFREMDKDMVTVPTCRPCNERKSLGDRDLRNYILLDIGGSQHPDALALLERMLRESNVRLRRWVQRTIAEAEEIDLVTDEGIIVGKALNFEFNTDRIISAQEMVARGLYFHETGRTTSPGLSRFGRTGSLECQPPVRTEPQLQSTNGDEDSRRKYCLVGLQHNRARCT